jgi:hypothetical protein
MNPMKMKFLISLIPFFSLLLTASSQAATPLDHLSPVEQREQLNREVCAWEVRTAINIHQTVLATSVKQLQEANDDERDGHAIIGIYLTEQVSKENIDCGKRLKKLILTSETSEKTEVIKINWDVWKMYQRGEITRTEWLKDFSTSITNKILPPN